MLIWAGAYLWHEKSRTRSIGSTPAAPVAESPPVQPTPEAQQPHNEIPRSDTPTGPPADDQKPGSKAKGESRQIPTSPEKKGGEAAPNNPTAEQLVEPRPPVTDGAGYFTVGSTKNDVRRVQGIPKEFSESEFDYGFSKVYFSHGVVHAWHNSRVNPLKVRLLPSTNIPRPEYFTVGSTQDDVLAIQGTPTDFSEDEFDYGSSAVYFSHGVVHSWNSSRDNPLEVRLLPSANIARPEYFTVGSTQDDVLAIQGTPTEFSEDEFDYGSSAVYFSHGVVHAWHNSRVNPLKVRLLPSANIARPEYFTVGSTKDDVLAIQGTPTDFSEDEFEYGFSTVYFSHNVVRSWDYSEANPLKVRPPPQ
jgi:outer membrane protein assembly factor BamE (lipoprotein component of BamABCDE complex)